MEKKLLPYLVVISALSVSLSAAFYSVTGLGKMFSGASVQVMIMMSSLEIAKLVLASLLYQYWSRLNKALKTYYFIALFVLMTITSAGIYGYLSSAYSDTLNKVENIDKQVKVLETKREMFQTQLNDARSEKERLNQNIAELTRGVSNNFVQSKDRNGNIITTTSAANRKVYEEQLKSSQKRRDDILLVETALNDSITKIDLKKLDLETNTDIAGEIGPLKYISKLTGKSMDEVINWFIIALMLVFDPLAVSLVVGANVIFRDKNKEKEKLKLSQEIDLKIADFEDRKVEIEKLNQDLENRENLISAKENDIQNRLLSQENEFKNKMKDLEMNYLERQKEIETKSLELSTLEEDLNTKIRNIEKNFKIKEESFDSYVREERSKIDSKYNELNQLKENLDQKEKSIESIVSDKINSAKSKIEEKVQELNKEKKNIQVQKSEIKKEWKEIDSEKHNLEKMRDDLVQKEFEVTQSIEELRRLDDEIKEWENNHWMLKKNKGYNGPPPPPPSAIV
jgi:septal ring factor EnvC (AmiA/AmiB activator)